MTIHFDIRIQGTPGSELMAVIWDRDTGLEIVVPGSEAFAQSFDDLFPLIQASLEARIRVRQEHNESPAAK